MAKILQEDIDKFVNNWVSANVCPAHGSTDLVTAIGHLSAHLTGDARTKGISGRELNKSFGDIDDYLTREYVKIANPRMSVTHS